MYVIFWLFCITDFFNNLTHHTYCEVQAAQMDFSEEFAFELLFLHMWFHEFFKTFIWVGVSKNKKVFENIYEITSHICRKTLHNSFDLSLWNTHHMLVNQHMIRPISLGYPMESISSDLFLIYTIRSQSAKKIELLEGLLINGVEYFLKTYLNF